MKLIYKCLNQKGWCMIQRDNIFYVYFLLFALLAFIVGCTKAPVMMEQPKPVVQPEVKQSIPVTPKKSETQPGSIIREKDDAVMMIIPAGEFLIGSPEGEGSSDEHPQHVVFLDAFYIDKYEVTNAQYKHFMDEKGYKAPAYWNDPKYNAPTQPVVGISWNDANAYAECAGARLPTEAEWEKAARGGLSGKKYPWGDTPYTHDNANYYGTGGKDVGDGPAPVGSFAPNGYGLCDVVGNVWEWCADWYDYNYYANLPKSNPKGLSSGSYKVLCGSSWKYHAYDYLRTASRVNFNPANLSYDIGFRCVQ